MPWIVGIDEAGYGPNLGPFVMTSVACRVPEDLCGTDLWKTLRPAVRRHPEKDDGRLLIEDSKLVYSPTRGLLDLETGVLATLSPPQNGEAISLAGYIDWACPTSHPGLRGESWYSGTSQLPVVAKRPLYEKAARRFQQVCKKRQIAWGLVRSVVLCPLRFNDVLDRWGSKGAVLGQALAELLEFNQTLGNGEGDVRFFVDKHGGRNNYAAMLQNAMPRGMVIAHEEGMDRSVYSVLGLERDVRLTFQPRADAEHFCVALASMVSKYLRELFMREFNQFWQAQVPGLKPTAGYPGDAARFFQEILSAVERLGLPEAAVWRRK